MSCCGARLGRYIVNERIAHKLISRNSISISLIHFYSDCIHPPTCHILAHQSCPACTLFCSLPTIPRSCGTSLQVPSRKSMKDTDCGDRSHLPELCMKWKTPVTPLLCFCMCSCQRTELKEKTRSTEGSEDDRRRRSGREVKVNS
jgi:hypothetical protein